MTMSERLLRVPEVARALGVDGAEVYTLIDRGEVKAVRGPDGLVYVSERALAEYGRRSAASSR